MTAPQRVTVLFGHPVPESYCNVLANAYCEGARTAGAEVREIHPAKLDFDPILWRAYLEIQQLEQGLLDAQQDLMWAQHIVVAFPVWWGAPPALLKGFFDRVMHPGFAFKYPTPQSVFQKKLLAGRSGRIICTMDAPPWYFRLCIGAPAVRMMKNSILKFCGVKPVRTSLIGSVRFSSPEKRERWIKQMQSLGRKRK